ncbi:MAG: DUF4383 domain-containing protein [Leifsonia sp.]
MHVTTNRLTAIIAGALWLVAGIAGFFVTPGVGFFSAPGALLVGLFAVNPAANVLAIVLGGALLTAGLSSPAAAGPANVSIGTVSLVLGLAGLFIIGTDANVLALNGADNVAHLASAVLLLAVGLGADRSADPASARTPGTRNDPRS